MARSLSPRRSAHGSRPLSAELLLQFVCRATVGAKTAFIAPGSPWKNGYCESFNSRFRDELLNGEVFTTLREAQILMERWRRHYNTVRPHSALGNRPPATKSIVPIDQRRSCTNIQTGPPDEGTPAPCAGSSHNSSTRRASVGIWLPRNECDVIVIMSPEGPLYTGVIEGIEDFFIQKLIFQAAKFHRDNIS